MLLNLYLILQIIHMFLAMTRCFFFVAVQHEMRSRSFVIDLRYQKLIKVLVIAIEVTLSCSTVLCAVLYSVRLGSSNEKQHLYAESI